LQIWRDSPPCFLACLSADRRKQNGGGPPVFIS